MRINLPPNYVSEFNRLTHCIKSGKKFDLDLNKFIMEYGFPYRVSKRGEKRAEKLNKKYYNGDRFVDDELIDAYGLLVTRSVNKKEAHSPELIEYLTNEYEERFAKKFRYPDNIGEITGFMLNRGYVEPNTNFVPELHQAIHSFLNEATK